MPKYIRRSIFTISVDDQKLGEKAFNSWADAIILRLVKMPGQNWQDDMKSRMPAAINLAAKGGAEVFVSINSQSAVAELESGIFPGLTGIVLAGAEGPQAIKRVSEYLDGLEERRGIAKDSLQIDVEIDTAAGVWNSLEIARASNRIATLTTGETGLYRNLGIYPEPELDFDPLEYIKSQLITNATSAGGQAQGISYPLSLTQKDAGEEELKKAIRHARDMGFKGAVCPHLSWIKVCNEGFRPSPEEVTYYRKVREVFAEGLRRGLASVPIEGRMVDVPVDLRARVYLEWADRCVQRDAEKTKAHEKTAS